VNVNRACVLCKQQLDFTTQKVHYGGVSHRNALMLKGFVFASKDSPAKYKNNTIQNAHKFVILRYKMPKFLWVGAQRNSFSTLWVPKFPVTTRLSSVIL